jgi:hypothetical protein
MQSRESGTRKATTKRIKRLLREQATAAYEEELRRALLSLAASFHEWEQGRLTSEELSELIHQFHQGPAQDLFVKYDRGMLVWAVSHAIVSGVLNKAEVPEELLQHLSRAIEYHEAEEREQ